MREREKTNVFGSRRMSLTNAPEIAPAPRIPQCRVNGGFVIVARGVY